MPYSRRFIELFGWPSSTIQEIEFQTPYNEDEFRRRVHDRKWRDALQVIDKNYALPLIVEWHASRLLTPDELNRVLAWHWNREDSPTRFGIQSLVSLFRFAGFVADREGTARPTGPLTIYRGGASSTPLGLSWTTDREQALKFARRSSRKTAVVITAVVQAEHILAILKARQESEIVVDPAGLKILREELVKFE